MDFSHFTPDTLAQWAVVGGLSLVIWGFFSKMGELADSAIRWVDLKVDKLEEESEEEEDDGYVLLDEDEIIVDKERYAQLLADAERYDAIINMGKITTMAWTGLDNSSKDFAPLPEAEGKVGATFNFTSHPISGETDEYTRIILSRLIDASVAYRQSLAEAEDN